MQNGIYLESISFSNIKAKKLYIKWNEKISFIVKEVDISTSKNNSKSNINYLKINDLLKSVNLFDNWFEKISIQKINFKDIQASFSYLDGEKGFIKASSPKFKLSSSLIFYKNLFQLHINELHIYDKDIKIFGDFILNNKNIPEITSLLKINIHDDIKLNIYSIANEKKLYYKIHSLKDITNIKHTVQMLKLDPKLKYWLYDAINMSSLDITSAYGLIEYNKLDEAINNLHVKAVINKLKYTYNSKIDSVNSDYTNLEFRDGVLFIRPQNAYSYGMYLGKSWLKIDFTKKDEMLTLHLLFDGILNKDMLHILKTYKIKIPFIQNSGILNTDLRLLVNLQTINVDAFGIFSTTKAQINYLGLDIDVSDTKVYLNNFDVKVKNMSAKYKDIIKAKVDLDFNAKDTNGRMDFHITYACIKDKNLTLKQDTLNVSYFISKEQDYISIDKSTWIYLNKNIKVDALKIPFTLKSLKADIPTSLLKIDNLVSADVSGYVIIKPLDIDLDISIKSIDTKNIKLDQEEALLKLKIDENITLFSKDDIRLKISNKKLRLNNFGLNISNDQLNIDKLFIDMEDIGTSTISTLYKLNDKKGEINVHNISLFNTKVGEILKNNSNSKIHIYNDKNETHLRSDEFDIDFVNLDDRWNLELKSLSKISKKSKLLQDYNLTKGYINLYQKNNEDNIRFVADIKYPYKILVKNNTPITKYKINGYASDNDFLANINDLVYVHINNQINIKACDVGINIDELLNLLSKHKNKKQKNNIKLQFDAIDSFIYFSKDRRAISQTMQLNYTNNVLKAELSHKKGIAWFELSDEKFRLQGNNFGDKFMLDLFALSEFKGGSLEFYLSGTTKDYNGMIYIKKTTIHDYVLLNNVLAFINTIPSLITFSLPGYNKNGLFINNAYINFNFKNDIYNISDIYMKSKEVSIVGKGKVSIKKNKIDLDLNLKTDLGSSISKIPLVGYILLGDDTISVSLKVDGKLDNPKVKTKLVQDIVVAPLNIIKRTILLPYNLITGKHKK